MEIINGIKVYTFEELLDRDLGPIGTPERDAFHAAVRAEVEAQKQALAKKQAKAQAKKRAKAQAKKRATQRRVATTPNYAGSQPCPAQ